MLNWNHFQTSKWRIVKAHSIWASTFRRYYLLLCRLCARSEVKSVSLLMEVNGHLVGVCKEKHWSITEHFIFCDCSWLLKPVESEGFALKVFFSFLVQITCQDSEPGTDKNQNQWTERKPFLLIKQSKRSVKVYGLLEVTTGSDRSFLNKLKTVYYQCVFFWI